MKAIVEYFLSKSLLLNLLTALIIIVGGYKAYTMNREAFPNINFDIVTITTIYPGASPSEVEKLVTKPIEENIKSVDGIKNFRSASIENRSGIVVTIDPNAKNTGKVVDDIKSAVERTENLPEDSKKPLVQEVTSARTPVIEISLGVNVDANGKDLLTEKEFKQKAKLLEELLLDIPEVGRVVRRGYRDTEMLIDIDPFSLDRLSISTGQIIQALKGKNINFPGGTIADSGREASVRTVAEFDTPSEIEKVFLRSNDAGRSISLKDVAKVTEGFEDKVNIERVNGFSSIVLVVQKKEKGDAITLVEKVTAIVNDFGAKQATTLNVSFVNDISKYIKRRLSVLVSNGITGFILVVISLFFFLGWRVALMVALGLPLAMALTFIILDYMNVTLNLISMLGLIIVVGMLVDDAIVISENIYRYLEEGIDVYDACVRGTVEVIAPVTATITTTIAAFGPMLFVTGIFGKFIYTIPLVVIISLASSLFEAFFILPSHIYDINKHGAKKGEIKEEGHWFEGFREKYYKPLLSWALLHKAITVILLVLALFGAFALQGKFGKFKLFPGGVEVFIVKISAETGLTLEETEKFAKAVEREVALLPKTKDKSPKGFFQHIQYFFHSIRLPVQEKFLKGEVDNYVTRVGIIQKDVNDPFTKRGKNFAQVMVYLSGDQDRSRSTDEIINYLRKRTEWMMNEKALAAAKEKLAAKMNQDKKKSADEEKEIPIEIPAEFAMLKGKLVALDLEAMAGGPPVGKPVAIEIKGDDYATLQKIGAEYKAVMSKVDGVIDISDDFIDGKDEIRLTINESLAARAGVSVQQIAIAINTAYQGTVATTIKRADEEVDVRVRFPENFRNSIRSLDKIFVTNNTGNLIPISRMTVFEKKPGLASINHYDGKRLLTVTANLDETKTTSQKANKDIKALAEGKDAIIDKYYGYRVRYGGENQDTEESMKSLGRSFMIAGLIIFIILVSLFKSVIQPFIVMTAIPFSLIGVILAFVTHGQYLSFLSMIGIVGLAGIVVNDSIVLVDFANQLRKEKPNLSSYEILLETGLIRLRPVILTTVTTVLGILPTAYGIGGADPFLMPMTLAIGWGLLFATVLTLIMIPVLYKSAWDIQTFIGAKWKAFKGRKTDLVKTT